MLLWISFLVLIIGILTVVAYQRSDSCSMVFDCASTICLIVGVFAVFISLMVVGINYTGIDGKVMAMKREYESLVYQYESDLYENYIDNGKRELMVDIQEWNENLAWYKANQCGFWIGAYIPNAYDQFEFIELVRE